MSTTSELTTLLEGGSFFEGPRWHDGRWWVSDFYRHRVVAVSPDGAEEQVMEVEGQPSGMGWLPDGSLLVVSMKDHLVLRRSIDGDVSVHADLSEFCGGHLNDMVVVGGRPRLRGQLRLRPDGRGRPEPRARWSASTPTAAPRSWRRTCCSRTAR